MLTRQEAIEFLEPYFTYVNALTGKKYVEQELDIGHITGEERAKGTTDLLNIDKDCLTALDLKTGQNKVHAADNPQLAIYAIAAYDAFGHPGIKTVRMVIVQPSLDWIDEWEVSVDVLDELRAQIAEKAKAAREQLAASEPVLNPGLDQCRYCKAAGRCKALAAYSAKAAELPPPPIAASRMDGKELSAALEKVATVELWCKRVREEALCTLQAGDAIPGWKLVAGKPGSRKWANEAEAHDYLRGKKIRCMAPRTLMSPAQLEKALKGNARREAILEAVSHFITRSEGKPAVVPESDTRKALITVCDSDFAPVI